MILSTTEKQVEPGCRCGRELSFREKAVVVAVSVFTGEEVGEHLQARLGGLRQFVDARGRCRGSGSKITLIAAE